MIYIETYSGTVWYDIPDGMSINQFRKLSDHEKRKYEVVENESKHLKNNTEKH